MTDILKISKSFLFPRRFKSRQLEKDYILAKELSEEFSTSTKEVWNPLANPIIETDEYGACSSKSVINSATIPNEASSSRISEADDRAIAQLLQAEFDLEFDEELKKIEQSRNKSNIVK